MVRVYGVFSELVELKVRKYKNIPTGVGGF